MRRLLILAHRYLGIALSLLFVSWFISGIVMMYTKGMPGLTPKLRLQRVAPLRAEDIHLTAADAIQKAALERPPARVILTTLAGRPVYRLGTKTVFADDGEVLGQVDAARALDVAAMFTNIPREKLHQSLQQDVDQWTISQRRQMPIHHITVDDADHTELYISTQTGDVAVMTTRSSRALAWIGAIPHWFYFTALRTKDSAWRQAVIWTSGLGSILALLGIILAFSQFKVKYSGWMRWHYVSGALFGIFTLTWVFSGMLSMDPWDWSQGGGLGNEIRGQLSGGTLNAAKFPPLDVASLGPGIREIEFSRIQGEPHYIVRTPEQKLLVSAQTLQARTAPFSVESLMAKVKTAYPNTPVVDSQLLNDYDAYYYSQDHELPLPILRVKFGDKDATWMYIDPAASQMLRSIHRLGRINRWIYHGFHSLDFAFLYYNWPAWSGIMILLSLGGATTSIIGVVIGFRRLRNLR